MFVRIVFLSRTFQALLCEPDNNGGSLQLVFAFQTSTSASSCACTLPYPCQSSKYHFSSQDFGEYDEKKINLSKVAVQNASTSGLLLNLHVASLYCPSVSVICFTHLVW